MDCVSPTKIFQENPEQSVTILPPRGLPIASTLITIVKDVYTISRSLGLSVTLITFSVPYILSATTFVIEL